MPEMTGHLLTTGQVATRLGVSPKTVRRIVASGRLRSIRLMPGARFRFEPADVENLIIVSGQNGTRSE